MLRKNKRRLLNQDNEEDPMSGTANLVDAMLVLAVGFLIFLVISWNMQDVVFSDMDSQEKQEAMKSMKQAAQVTMGKELNNTSQSTSGSGSGMVEMGKVYKDPKTGKLIMVEN